TASGTTRLACNACWICFSESIGYSSTADTCPGVTPTCAAIVSRSSPWASSASTAWRWLSVILGGMAMGFRVLDLVQHVAQPRVNRCCAVLDETFCFVLSELCPQLAVDA